MTTSLGLDLSLASTGLAVVIDGKLVHTGNITSRGTRDDRHPQYMARIAALADQINTWLADASARYGEYHIAAIEAPSFRSQNGNPHERAGLWWKVYEHLWSAEVRIETLAPATRAKYIAGNGRASKEAVLAAAHYRWGADLIPNHDVADACGMAMWGNELLKGEGHGVA